MIIKKTCLPMEASSCCSWKAAPLPVVLQLDEYFLSLSLLRVLLQQFGESFVLLFQSEPRSHWRNKRRELNEKGHTSMVVTSQTINKKISRKIKKIIIKIKIINKYTVTIKY